MVDTHWHHPSGLKNVWEMNGRWVSLFNFVGREYPFHVTTMKMGIGQTLGNFKTKKAALSLIKQYIRSHPNG